MKSVYKFVLVFFVCVLSSCSGMSDSSPVFSAQVTAEAFVTELNGSTVQTITINHNADSKIAWAKLTEAKDFKYFQIEKVTANGQTIVEAGQNDFVSNSRAMVPEFSVQASEAQTNTLTNGELSSSQDEGLQFMIRFAPQQAPDQADKPFEATLEIYYTEPTEGVYLVNLQGFVQGLKNDKCTQNISSYEIHKYKFKNEQFGFYMCSPEVAKTGNANAEELGHGSSTNFTQMPIVGDFYFYQPDDETVCLMHENNTAGPEYPSVPNFKFLIPEGLAEVSSLDLKLFSTAECSVDSTTGQIFCDHNIFLDTLISISAMTATTGSVSASELITTQCPDFGAISGSGGLGDDNLSLVLYGTVLSDSITQSYNIVDALILGVIDLEK